MLFEVPGFNLKFADRFVVYGHGLAYFLGAKMVYFLFKSADPETVAPSVVQAWRDAEDSMAAGESGSGSQLSGFVCSVRVLYVCLFVRCGWALRR